MSLDRLAALLEVIKNFLWLFDPSMNASASKAAQASEEVYN
jgi:hypothetical protein